MPLVLDNEAAAIADIRLVGVGGSGCQALDILAEKRLPGVQCIAVDSDASALWRWQADKRILLPSFEEYTSDRLPVLGRRGAQQASDKIASALQGAQLVFVLAGMGGAVGSGAAQVVARLAKRQGILTLGVVNTPPPQPDADQNRQTQEALRELVNVADSVLLLDGQEETPTAPETAVPLPLAMARGAEGLISLLNSPAFIQLDLYEVRSVLQNAGRARMGRGSAAGPNKAVDAAAAALASPPLQQVIKNAAGILLDVRASSDVSLDEMDTVAALVTQASHPDANILWGCRFDSALTDAMCVTVQVTGIDRLRPRSPLNRARKTPAAPQPVPLPSDSSQETADDEDDFWTDIQSLFRRRDGE